MNYSELQAELQIAPLNPDGSYQVGPYRPETPLPPSTWRTDPAPAADYSPDRPAAPATQTAPTNIAELESRIQTLPPAQREAVTQVVDMAKSFTASMLQAGVDKRLIQAAATWIDRTISTKKIPSEQRNHSFDLRAFNLQDDPYVTSFANHMAKVGASQKDVVAALDWYMRWMAQQQQRSKNRQTHQPAEQDFTAQDAADRAHCKSVLKAEWGESYFTNLRAINRYLDSLPAVERDEIESATLPSGGLELNSPDVLEYLLVKASGSPSPLAAEISALEQRMKNDRKAWFRDETAQARLRTLYQKRDGK